MKHLCAVTLDCNIALHLQRERKETHQHLTKIILTGSRLKINVAQMYIWHDHILSQKENRYRWYHLRKGWQFLNTHLEKKYTTQGKTLKLQFWVQTMNKISASQNNNSSHLKWGNWTGILHTLKCKCHYQVCLDKWDSRGRRKTLPVRPKTRASWAACLLLPTAAEEITDSAHNPETLNISTEQKEKFLWVAYV